MSDRLLELAWKAGVAIVESATSNDTTCSWNRPRLDIAHDLLATLPECGMSYWTGEREWEGSGPQEKTVCPTCGDVDQSDFIVRGTFEWCVVALAERAMCAK